MMDAGDREREVVEKRHRMRVRDAFAEALQRTRSTLDDVYGILERRQMKRGNRKE